MYEKNNFQPGDMLYAHQLNSMDDKIYELDSTSTIPCNQNLLDNWDFSNPVNQRGQTTYKTTSTAMYTIDRWKLSNGGNTLVAPPESHILYLATNPTESSVLNFTQILPKELVKYLTGRTVTLTVQAGGKNGNFYISEGGGFAKEHKDKAIGNGLTSYTFEVNTESSIADLSNCSIYIWSTTPNSSIYIAAIKLEVGEKQTLAHMENGNLVLNEKSDYAEELRKCQRYYIAGAGRFMPIFKVGSTQFAGTVALPMVMRTRPNLIMKEYDNIVTQEGNVYGVSSCAVYDLKGNFLSVLVNTSSAPSSGSYGEAFTYGTMFDLSADL